VGGAHTRALVASVIGDIVGIPRITRWGRPSARFPYPFAGHDVIPGVDASDPRAPRNPALADDIGRALRRLHAIPPEAAAAAGAFTATLDVADWAAALERVRRWVSEVPEIRGHVPGACAWLDAAPPAPDLYRGPPRFIHDDFQMEHVLVSPTTGRLTGIVDWGGGLGDPAADAATCCSTAAGRSSSGRWRRTTCRSTRSSPGGRCSPRASERSGGSRTRSSAARARRES
jgi:aminoglycoside phosphotransferase (APT) family kinase protein